MSKTLPEYWYIKGCEELKELLYPATSVDGGFPYYYYHHGEPENNDFLSSIHWTYKTSFDNLDAKYIEITVNEFKKYLNSIKTDEDVVKEDCSYLKSYLKSLNIK